MIQKNSDAITKADIDALITSGVVESKTLEYKQELPGNSDADKKEFLADVSSFGNASGGDIIYGIKAAVDAEGKKTGAPKAVRPIVSATADDAKLRLEETIRNSIDPRLRVQIKEITGWGADGQGFVILLRIPKSFASPHMVTYKGSTRFFSRHSAGKYPLDVGELRTAFLATESQGERIQRFRQDRLGKIVADETPVVLSSPRRLVLHLIPIPSFLNNERLEIADRSAPTAAFRPIESSGWDQRYNLDGLVSFEGGYSKGQSHASYCQLFFTGTVEAVWSEFTGREGDSTYIASVAYEQEIIRAVESYLEGFRRFGLTPPVVVSLAVVGCKGAVMYVDQIRRSARMTSLDRDPAILPDTVIDNLNTDAAQIMRPIFDALWNACGFARSFNYDKDGNWKPR